MLALLAHDPETCPDCAETFEDCRCIEDLLLERSTQRHPGGCACCIDEVPSVRFPLVARQTGQEAA